MFIFDSLYFIFWWLLIKSRIWIGEIWIMVSSKISKLFINWNHLSIFIKHSIIHPVYLICIVQENLCRLYVFLSWNNHYYQYSSNYSMARNWTISNILEAKKFLEDAHWLTITVKKSISIILIGPAWCNWMSCSQSNVNFIFIPNYYF